MATDPAAGSSGGPDLGARGRVLDLLAGGLRAGRAGRRPGPVLRGAGLVALAGQLERSPRAPRRPRLAARARRRRRSRSAAAASGAAASHRRCRAAALARRTRSNSSAIAAGVSRSSSIAARNRSSASASGSRVDPELGGPAGERVEPIEAAARPSAGCRRSPRSASGSATAAPAAGRPAGRTAPIRSSRLVKLPSDFDIFSPSTSTKPLCTQ